MLHWFATGTALAQRRTHFQAALVVGTALRGIVLVTDIVATPDIVALGTRFVTDGTKFAAQPQSLAVWACDGSFVIGPAPRGQRKTDTAQHGNQPPTSHEVQS